MSMPNFPDDVFDLTYEQSLNMLLGSIAMEELALSHILNAEGEKLQYVLGTLPRKPCGCASSQEVLEINRSVSDLLEKVAYNQILLKGKLREVLDAKSLLCPPDPPCPPVSSTPPCPPRLDHPCILTGARNAVWSCTQPLPWKRLCGSETTLCWQGCSPGLVHLYTHLTYLVSFSISVHTNEPGQVQATLQSGGSRTGEDLLRCEGYASASDLTAHLSGCTVLSPRGLTTVPRAIQLRLKTPDSVVLERATLYLAAI